MARIVYYNRTRETTSGTPGTSTTITLTGASTGHRTFGSHSDLVVGDTFYYLMEDLDDNDWEIGLGTWQGSNTFDRPTVVLDNSSGGTSKINFGSNSEVALIWSAEAVDDLRINQLDKLVLTSTDVVDVFLYDTSLDTNGGAWRKKTRHTSWYNETLNTATRGATKEFPKVVLLVLEGGATNQLTIYDATDFDIPMWAVRVGGTSSDWYRAASTSFPLTSVAAKNGQIIVGANAAGYFRTDFIKDTHIQRFNSGSREYLGQSTWVDTNLATIVNANVNDVAITALSGAETDTATDLPFPTIEVMTDTGSSWINHDGSLANENVVKDGTGAVVLVSGDIDTSGLCALASATDVYAFESVPAIDTALASADFIMNTSVTTGPTVTGTITSVVISSATSFEVGTSEGLFRVDYVIGTGANSVVTRITKDFNTGGQSGDIRLAALANSKTADRSVKANTLTENGTVTEAAVATGAELNGYSGWSASNNLTRASDADWDVITTGSLTALIWFKTSANSAVESYIGFANAGNTIRFLVTMAADGTISCVDDGATASVVTASTVAFDDGQWHLAAFVRTSSTSRALYIDGVSVASNTTDAGSLTGTGTLPLGVGVDPDGSSTPATTSTLALARLTAYAPTAAQIKKMYNDEKWLFVDNTDCLLGGTSDSVKALSYDSTSDRLFVGTADKTSVFQKFNRLETIEATGNNTLTSDDHVAVSAQSEYYSIGSAAEANVQVPEKSLIDLA